MTTKTASRPVEPPTPEDLIRQDLTLIRTRWAASHNPPTPRDENPTRTHPASTPPGNTTALDAHRETLDILTRAATLVVQGRQLKHTRILRGDAPELCWLLDKHAMWIADNLLGDHDWPIGETPHNRRVTFATLDQAIHHAATRIDNLAAGNRTRRYRVWSCVATTTLTDEEGIERETPCPGSLYTIMSTDERIPSLLKCDHNPTHHQWSAREWLHLGRQLYAQAGRATTSSV